MVDWPEDGLGLVSASVEQHKEMEGPTLADLSAKWSDVVDALERVGVKVVNPDHALEGALSIRYAQCLST